MEDDCTNTWDSIVLTFEMPSNTHFGLKGQFQCPVQLLQLFRLSNSPAWLDQFQPAGSIGPDQLSFLSVQGSRHAGFLPIASAQFGFLSKAETSVSRSGFLELNLQFLFLIIVAFLPGTCPVCQTQEALFPMCRIVQLEEVSCLPQLRRTTAQGLLDFLCPIRLL